MNGTQPPEHSNARKLLVIGGLLIVAVGGLLTLVGIGSLFASMTRSTEPPSLVFCAFAGLPLLLIGAAMGMFGFFGRSARHR